jgi:hypothetical protein
MLIKFHYLPLTFHANTSTVRYFISVIALINSATCNQLRHLLSRFLSRVLKPNACTASRMLAVEKARTQHENWYTEFYWRYLVLELDVRTFQIQAKCDIVQIQGSQLLTHKCHRKPDHVSSKWQWDTLTSLQETKKLNCSFLINLEILPRRKYYCK